MRASETRVSETKGGRGGGLRSWIKDPQTQNRALVGASLGLLGGAASAYLNGESYDHKLAGRALIGAASRAVGGTFANPFVGSAASSAIWRAPDIYGKFKRGREGLLS